jgi:hypothetical protein
MYAMHRVAPWLCSWVTLGACSPSAPSLSLQKQCDRDASAWFQRQHPDGVSRETVDTAIRTEQFTFSDHYNPRMQRCLAIVSEEKSTVYPDRPAEGVTSKSLVDLQTGRRLGGVVKPWPSVAVLRDCEVEAKGCGSIQEWEALAAPYMER